MQKLKQIFPWPKDIWKMVHILFQNKLWQLLSDGIIAGLLTLAPRLVSYSALMVGPYIWLPVSLHICVFFIMIKQENGYFEIIWRESFCLLNFGGILLRYKFEYTDFVSTVLTLDNDEQASDSN